MRHIEEDGAGPPAQVRARRNDPRADAEAVSAPGCQGKLGRQRRIWLALGDEPRSHRLAAIPGCTATERRVFGIVDADLPPQPEAKKPLAQQVADMTGVTLNTARDRVRRFRAGEISLREMYAAPRAEESRRSIDAVVARVGCCRSAAAARLRRFRIGMITEAQLYAPTTGGRK